MFGLSTRARYGMRAMGELALRHGDGPVQLSVIADKQDLSRRYLHALFTQLKHAGIVRAVRGAAGGFLLSRSPAEITLLEVLEALEGPIGPVACVNDPSTCDRLRDCPTHELWGEAATALEGVFRSKTLTDLADRLVDKRGTTA